MAADGTPLVSFVDFVTATKPHKLTPTTEILNETTRNCYFLSMMLRDRPDSEVVQNGQKIIDMIRLKEHNSFSYYHPTESLQPRGMDVLTQIEVPWRFSQANYAWSDEQTDLNGSNSEDNWVKLMTAWRQASAQDVFEGMEDALWADFTPDMEAATGKTPYSILSFVTPDGLAPTGATTLMGLNPATEAGWRNQTDSYTAADLPGTLYQAFDSMFLDLKWEVPPGQQKWAKGTKWDKLTIVTNKAGVTQYLNLNRDSNDRLVPMNDPGTFQNRVKYNGIEIKRVSALDEKAYTNPPYLWLDAKYLFPVFHKNRYMDELDPIRGGINQPFSWAVYKRTYHNLFCRSRRRHGYVSGT